MTAGIVRLSDYRRSDDEKPVVDLVTAVDVAIRDLDDILSAWGSESAQLQTIQCRELLLAALSASCLALAPTRSP